jgi:hypothetical protein
MVFVNDSAAASPRLFRDPVMDGQLIPFAASFVLLPGLPSWAPGLGDWSIVAAVLRELYPFPGVPEKLRLGR